MMQRFFPSRTKDDACTRHLQKPTVPKAAAAASTSHKQQCLTHACLCTTVIPSHSWPSHLCYSTTLTAYEHPHRATQCASCLLPAVGAAAAAALTLIIHQHDCCCCPLCRQGPSSVVAQSACCAELWTQQRLLLLAHAAGPQERWQRHCC